MRKPLPAGCKGLSPRLRGNLRLVFRSPLLGGSIPALTGKPPEGDANLVVALVYPRAYGETMATLRRLRAVAGLSPRLRGNPGGILPDRFVRRSIPALTGKPTWVAIRRRCWRVYPRAYGETCTCRPLMFCTRGLSPRLRGNPVLTGTWPWWYGSIPALTGKPGGRVPTSRWPAVYPRAYGETAEVIRGLVQEKGLSPRLRGNPGGTGNIAGWVRSIPALTGKPPR